MERKKVQKSGQQECEYHSYPACVTGSTQESLLYLVACGTLQVPMRLSKKRCKAPMCKVVALETEAGENQKTALIVNITQQENIDVNGSSMVVKNMNIVQHENICEINLEVQPETDPEGTVRFTNAIMAVDESSSLLVTGILR